jgi:hypothetical protein
MAYYFHALCTLYCAVYSRLFVEYFKYVVTNFYLLSENLVDLFV